jgi:prevent-host-death family protein
MKMNVQEAKAQLSRLVDAAMAGDEVIIAKAGKACVRLVPMTQAARLPGAAKGKAALTPAFFDPVPDDELRGWDGR